MATENLAASATGTNNAWTLTAGANKPAAVALPDDDATTYLTGAPGAKQEFSCANPATILAGDTINSVTIIPRVKNNGASNASIRYRVKDGANVSVSADTKTSASWITQSTAAIFTQKPGGGGPWTLTILNNLVIEVENFDADDSADMTTFYALVTFTPLQPIRNMQPIPVIKQARIPY